MKITIEGKMEEIHDLINEIQDRGQIEAVQSRKRIALEPSQSSKEEKEQLVKAIQEVIVPEQDPRRQHDQEEHTPNQE
ncbi:hypothetical protein [Anaerotignum lactatifermentans]|uniref:hypothetical protein n=1 Tax=Anaerotignum lactatifermentans TaxID=160404 RepID=UPI00248E3423|nr:hypothetical protein [Anaerotignum lactatifermentans]